MVSDNWSSINFSVEASWISNHGEHCLPQLIMTKLVSVIHHYIYAWKPSVTLGYIPYRHLHIDHLDPMQLPPLVGSSTTRSISRILLLTMIWALSKCHQLSSPFFTNGSWFRHCCRCLSIVNHRFSNHNQPLFSIMLCNYSLNICNHINPGFYHLSIDNIV